MGAVFALVVPIAAMPMAWAGAGPSVSAAVTDIADATHMQVISPSLRHFTQ
jgi:hypothetical protein